MQRQTWKRSALLAAGVLWMVASGVQTTHAEPPEVFSTWLDSAKTNDPWGAAVPVVMDLDVPAGHYMTIAKLFTYAHNNFPLELRCTLQAGADYDVSIAQFDGAYKEQVVVLTVVHSFATAGRIRLDCREDGLVGLEHIKITATKVNALNNYPHPAQ